MRSSNPFPAMQKTYDDCFLTCSTAVYFEGQASIPQSTPQEGCAYRYLRTYRTTKPKHYAHGETRWTKYTTTTPTKGLLGIGREQRRSGLLQIHYINWNYNAGSVWIFWRP